MREQIQRLMEVQRLDTHTLELEEKGKNISIRFGASQQKFEEKKKVYETKKQELETLEKDLRSKERKLEATNDSLKKYQNQIYSIKTQKEAEAIDHEIAKAKMEIDRLEDRILTLMEERDSLRRSIEENGREVEKEAKELSDEETRYQEELILIGQELNSARERRTGLIPHIGEELLSLYDKLRQKKENIAIVTIKAGACGGCFMNLPPQVINEVKISARPITCENCSRILHWEEE